VLNELQRRNYSPETARGYIHAIKQFAGFFRKSPEQLGGDEIRQFELHLLKEKKLAPGTVEGRMSALRFLYKKVWKRRDVAYDDLIFPKVPRKLPVVLSPEEITRMIEAAPNLMHRTILMLLYATGIRRAEASLLKVSDIDSERMVIPILQGKGSRDRDVPMTPKLLETLREYWRWKRPKVYLFPSTEGHRGQERPISDSYNSCRNRHCPKCQTNAREKWLCARRRELLPVCTLSGCVGGAAESVPTYAECEEADLRTEASRIGCNFQQRSSLPDVAGGRTPACSVQRQVGRCLAVSGLR